MRKTKDDNLHAIAADARKKRLLHYARRQLIKCGYTNASINDVIRLAGGSKATLKKYFGNKAGLYSAVFDDVGRQFVERMNTLNFSGSLERTLQNMGEELLRFYLQPDAINAFRAIVAEGYRNKQLAAGLYQGGHMALVHAVASRLEPWQAKGRIHCVDLLTAADQFTHILRRGLYEETLIGLRKPKPPAREIADTVRLAVKTFLRILRP